MTTSVFETRAAFSARTNRAAYEQVKKLVEAGEDPWFIVGYLQSTLHGAVLDLETIARTEQKA